MILFLESSRSIQPCPTQFLTIAQIISQYAGTPLEGEMFSTKKAFQANLVKRRGTSFVVLHDPLESNTFVQTPQGQVQSNIWVIRKQYRDEPYSDNIKALAYYYIINQAIYQAPSIEKVLESRLLNVTTSLDRLLSKTAEFPLFSASHGNTYVPTTQKTLSAAAAAPAQQSKEGTPMALDGPGVENVVKHGDRATEDDEQEESGTLAQAFRLTMQWRHDFANETPLEGEPGNFRHSKRKEVVAKDGVAQQVSSQYSGSRIGTPAHSRSTSVAIQGR